MNRFDIFTGFQFDNDLLLHDKVQSVYALQLFTLIRLQEAVFVFQKIVPEVQAQGLNILHKWIPVVQGPKFYGPLWLLQ